jgi:hypothetical protein
MATTDDDLVPIEIDAEVYADLKARADAFGLSIAEYLRLVIERLGAP